MAVSLLARLAASAPVPVFAAAGVGAGLAHVELAADPRLRLVASPRHATVLVASGRFPGALGAALARVHDQLPHPRGAVWWRADGGGDAERPLALDAAPVASSLDDAAQAAVDQHRRLVRGEQPSRADVLPDVPPNLFEGRGDHGQGGEGMMGGVPYGRPMAMTGPDRDGLDLDRSSARLGPFLVGLPPGLALDVVLQGGVVQEADPVDLGVGPVADAPLGPSDADRAAERVHRLRWVAEACRLGGLDALAARVARSAVAAGGGGLGPDVERALARRVRRSGLVATWRGVGEHDGAARRLAAALALLDPGARDPDDPETEAPPTIGRLGDLLLGLDWADAVVLLHSLDLSRPVRRQEVGA